MSSRSASTSEPAGRAGATGATGGPGTAEGRRGAVVVVSTPIGNLGDLSPRAVEALAGADLVYCEDTRRTLKLFTHASIAGPRLVAHHRFNEAATTQAAMARLDQGARIALVTDAGTPMVSDPGGRLVKAAIEAGFDVEVVPGPSAALAALVVSGLATDRWCFEGFVPRQGRERKERLAAIAAETDRAVVVFESPYRAQRLLADLVQACGPERPAAVCRELTKLHEHVWRGRLGDALEQGAAAKAKGEYVIVLGPPAMAGRASAAPM